MAPDGQPFSELWGEQGFIQFRKELRRRVKSEAACDTKGPSPLDFVLRPRGKVEPPGRPRTFSGLRHGRSNRNAVKMAPRQRPSPTTRSIVEKLKDVGMRPASSRRAGSPSQRKPETRVLVSATTFIAATTFPHCVDLGLDLIRGWSCTGLPPGLVGSGDQFLARAAATQFVLEQARQRGHWPWLRPPTSQANRARG